MKTKMKLMASLKIWVAIYPSITLLLFLFGDALSPLPLYQRTFLLTVSLVPWIVFVGIPFIDLVMGINGVKQGKTNSVGSEAPLNPINQSHGNRQIL